MVDFSKQQSMLDLAIKALKSVGIYEHASFGGGTALSSFYWQHRYSTDIDIFIEHKDTLPKLREYFNALHVNYDVRYPGHYLEVVISEYEKIQFFETKTRTKMPYIVTSFWGHDGLRVESVEEILAKKIHYRASKGNTRDIFDIALGLSKNPQLLAGLLGFDAISEKDLLALKEAIENIVKSEELKMIYDMEIEYINPTPKYKKLAEKACEFLLEYI